MSNPCADPGPCIDVLVSGAGALTLRPIPDPGGGWQNLADGVYVQDWRGPYVYFTGGAFTVTNVIQTYNAWDAKVVDDDHIANLDGTGGVGTGQVNFNRPGYWDVNCQAQFLGETLAPAHVIAYSIGVAGAGTSVGTAIYEDQFNDVRSGPPLQLSSIVRVAAPVTVDSILRMQVSAGTAHVLTAAMQVAYMRPL